MAQTMTGFAPLGWPGRFRRFLRVGWTFLVVYLSYKRIQKTRGLTPAEKSRRIARAHARNAERIYRLAIQMEGLMIKMCQFISSRADVAPPEYVHVLSRLQDQVPPRSFAMVVRQVRRSLGAAPDELFERFTRAPIAAASLAQVHRAVTLDGHEVAVKVQYETIGRLLETDLRNLDLLVRILARLEPNFDFRVIMDEAKRDVPRELDFELEGRSAERIARNLAHRPDVRVPRIYWELSGPRVLTLEYIEGTKISDIPALQAMGVDPNQVALIMTEAYCEQILIHGYFHADPHPGNLLVLAGPVVVFLDFGLCKELAPRFRLNYARLVHALIRQDDSEMVRAFRELGFETRHDSPETLVALGRSFFEVTGSEGRPYVDADLMPEVNERLARVLQANPVTRIPGDILLIFRVVGLMSGLQKRLDSRVNMIDTIGPYAASQALPLIDPDPAEAAG